MRLYEDEFYTPIRYSINDDCNGNCENCPSIQCVYREQNFREEQTPC